jgi:hypothetical protein
MGVFGHLTGNGILFDLVPTALNTHPISIEKRTKVSQ